MNEMRVALIPAYEPDNRLITLVDKLKNRDFVVVVVDDGSGNEYDEVFSQLQKKAVVLCHEENKGKGAALKTGLSYIKTCFGRRCVVVTLDADGQHTVDDALNVCDEAIDYPDELVLGSRGFEGDVPVKSRMGNTITRFVYHLFTGTFIHDTQTGLRAFSGSLIDELLAIEGDRYEYEMNMLLTCSARHIPMREIRIETIYEGNNEVSHFNAVSDSIRIYKEIIKFSASSFLSFLLDYFLYLIILMIGGRAGFAYTLVIANVTARLISGTFNYTINRRAVFESNEAVWQSAIRYIILAASILLFNTMCLQFLVGLVGMNAYAAKLIVECLMFVISFLAQKRIVFAAKEVYA